MPLDVAQLLAPVSDARPAGIDLRGDEAEAPLYYRLKDARATARVAERQADVEAERGPVPAEWRTIFDLSQQVLRDKSKDIEVAAWFTEAALRLHGFPGLHGGFALLDGLVERYWDTLHSLDPDDVSAKVAPLAGLNGVDADGALIQPIRLAPITAPPSGVAGGLWHYMVLRRRGAASPEAVLLAAAARSTDAGSFRALHGEITGALARFTALTNRLDALCGPDSPPSSTIRNTLAEAAEALRTVSGLSAEALGPPAAVADTVPEEVEAVAAVPEAATAAAPPAVYTRDDALRELGRIAEFFRVHEPHSPIGFTLETLIRRARMPLGDLLRELVPDAAVRRSFLLSAGVSATDVGEQQA